MKNSESSFIILSLYVDDILLASIDLKMLNEIKDQLKSQFQMKDMGKASLVLGIKIIRDRKIEKLIVSQKKLTQIVGEGAISWANKKQTCVVHYTMEAETITYSTIVTKVV